MGWFGSNSVGNKGRRIKDSLNHRVVHRSIRDSPPGTMGEKETEKWEDPGWGRGATLMQNLSSAHGQAPWVVEGSRPPANWPQQGEVEFRNYSVRYRPGLELVLKDLSLRVHGGEKVRVGGFVPGKWPYSLWGVWVFGRASAPARMFAPPFWRSPAGVPTDPLASP